jgi:hypothetical protein
LFGWRWGKVRQSKSFLNKLQGASFQVYNYVKDQGVEQIEHEIESNY